MRNKNLSCPFCNGKIVKTLGIKDELIFHCMSETCGAVITFKDKFGNQSTYPEERFNRREVTDNGKS